MRVVAGSAKSLKLKTIEGMETRPTQDRIKETLFNMIQYDIPGSTFLDLFSGSGGIGIEALSRGAKEAYFVEKAKPALRCIRENLRYTKLDKKAQVLATDVNSAIRQLETKNVPCDIPPIIYSLQARSVFLICCSSNSKNQIRFPPVVLPHQLPVS